MVYCKNCGLQLEKNFSGTSCPNCSQHERKLKDNGKNKIYRYAGFGAVVIAIGLTFLFFTSSGEKLRMKYIGIDLLPYSGLTEPGTHKMKNTFISDDETSNTISTITNKGEKVIDGKSVYEVHTTNYNPEYDYTTEYILFYSYSNKGMLKVGLAKSEDNIYWTEEEEASIYLPSKLKFGEEYSHKEGDEVLNITLEGMQDIQIGQRTFKNCLFIKEKLIGSNGQISSTSEFYFAKGTGLVKQSETRYFEGEATYKTNMEFID
ncbi:hypothetical protein [Rossellomorea sp. KS-H15a]|uniref:hypothetical protein n=1 Tax=Rossellomorea sp. KS-H15a TaxID=2963940 RepID=UPI0020C6EDEA|nr:hypothetical protein [Rossellomorea sp. KS-H15a]UTE77444.1 hypothetical protein M1J35_01090 [Rossellomorea sp. KS-H15a]